MKVELRAVDSQKNYVNQEVLDGLEKQLAQNPEDPELWFKLGQEYFGTDFVKAVHCFSTALVYAPFNGEYYFNRGRKYVSLDLWDQGLADFIMSIRIEPEHGMKWHYAGVCCFYKDEYEQAVEYFTEAVRTYRRTGVELVWPSVDWIYMSWMRLGQPEKAIAALDLVQNDEPVDVTDYFYKKRVLLYKGVTSPQDYLKDLDRHNNLDALTELYALANYYYYQANQPDEAAKIIDEIVAMPDYHNAFGYKSALINKEERK